MRQLSVLVQFFTQHSQEDAQNLCEEIAQTGSLKVRLVDSTSAMKSEQIVALISVPKAHVQEVANRLCNIALYIAEVTHIDDIVVKVMGHPDVAYRTNPPAPLQA